MLFHMEQTFPKCNVRTVGLHMFGDLVERYAPFALPSICLVALFYV
jgi:hypothetical protein